MLRRYTDRLSGLLRLTLCTTALFMLSTATNAASYVWNGSVSTEWGNPLNWTPNGMPDLGDDVVISNQTNNPIFEEISGLNNFTMTSGTLDLSYFTMVVTGTATFNGGSISNGNISMTGPAIFSGTTLSAGITINSSSFQFNGGTFNNAVSATYTGSSDITSSGGNTFNSTFTLSNSGSGNVTLCNTNPDTYKGSVTFSNSGSGIIFPSHTATGNSFQGSITFNSTSSSQGVRFGQNGGTSTLTSSNTLNIGGSGFSVGDLRLKSFTTSGTTAQTLTLTGSAALYIEAGCSFGGNITFTTPQVFLNGATFSGTSTISKTGTTSNQSLGGNTFTGAASISNSGSGDLILGVSNPDVFSSTSTFSNSGSGTMFVAQLASGTLFNDNVVVTSTGSSRGIRFGQSGGTSVLASGKTITIGGGGFTAGSLRLRGLTQNGSTSQTLSIASGTAQLYLEANTTFNGSVNFSFPQIFLSGTTFNNTTTITKNGSTDNTGSGGNTFNAAVTLANTGSGRLTTGNSSADTFNGALTLNSTGSSSIQLAHAATGTAFNENIIVNSTGSSLGILFGESGGTSTLASTKTITIGGSGFSNGNLSFKGFTQTGATAQSITSATGSSGLIIGAATTFNGDVTFSSPRLNLNGGTFNSTALLTKNGSGGDISNGGNTFQAATTLVNSGDGELLMANSNPDIFNADLVIENSGYDVINMAYAASGTEFNGNIELNSIGSAGGIRFGQNSGSSTLASGKAMSIGTSGYTSGDLRISNFTQVGSTSQTLTSFGTDVEVYLEENTTFNGDVIVTSPGMYLNGTTFNGQATITKTGTGFNLSSGGNIFNGVATISNTGSGTFIMAGSSADDFNENVTFLQTNAFTLYPAYNINSTFAKNISTVGSATSVFFAANGGRVTLNGTSAQAINGDASQKPDFYNLTINNSGSNATLNVPTIVSNSLVFTSGKIISSSTNLLTMTDNSSVSGVSHTSHVQGPVRKEGNDAFTFPIGKSNYYRPIAMSAPSSVTDHFTAEFYMADSDGSYSHGSKDPSIDHLSHCEFWILDRTNGSSSVSVTLSWNSTSCGVTNLGDLKVARWNGSMWKDHGNAGTTGNTSVGTVTSSGAISSFSPFTLSSSSSENPLPVNLVHFSASPKDRDVLVEWTTVSESNSDYYIVESSSDAINFNEVARTSGAGNSNITLNYRSIDNSPFPGISYYRLKQVDYDGKFMYSHTEAVNMPTLWESDMVISPNPVVNLVDIRLDPDAFVSPTLELRDLQGKLVSSYQIEKVDVQKPFRIDLSELGQGMYFMNVSENGHSLSKRIIKR
jgi:hypothetical protein